jgi:hypothetical protein
VRSPGGRRPPRGNAARRSSHRLGITERPVLPVAPVMQSFYFGIANTASSIFTLNSTFSTRISL